MAHHRLILILLVAVSTTGVASIADAATCIFDQPTAQVSVSLNAGESGSLSVSSANLILVNNVACGGATTTNTDLINVVGAAGNETLQLTSACAAYGPGLSAEAGGSSEIEIVIDLGAGADMLILSGGPSADTIILGADGINCNGDDDADNASTGIEKFRVLGLGGDDLISAAGGSGTGAPLPARALLYGQDGSDALIGGPLSDYLSGGAGDDSLSGGAGNDSLVGGAGDDVAEGEDGDDLFDEEPVANGADVLQGGAGTDRVSYAGRGVGLSLSLDDVADDGEPGEFDNLASDIEYISSGSGDDTIVGSSVVNLISGGAGHDLIEGGDGNDKLLGGAGDDQIRGGNGSDIMSGGDGDDVLYAEPSADGADQFRGGAGMDCADYSARSSDLRLTLDAVADNGEVGEKDRLSSDIEVVLSGSGNDYIVGSNSSELSVLVGADGDDVIKGTFGYNFIDGGPGNDSLYGGPDYDDIFGGDGHDYLSGGGGDDDLEGQEGDDRIDGDGGWDFIAGGPGNDVLSGGADPDWIEGEDGDDILIGDDGDDSLWGGEGDDQVSCGEGYDIVVEPDWADDCEQQDSSS